MQVRTFIFLVIFPFTVESALPFPSARPNSFSGENSASSKIGYGSVSLGRPAPPPRSAYRDSSFASSALKRRLSSQPSRNLAYLHKRSYARDGLESLFSTLLCSSKGRISESLKRYTGEGTEPMFHRLSPRLAVSKVRQPPPPAATRFFSARNAAVVGPALLP